MVIEMPIKGRGASKTISNSGTFQNVFVVSKLPFVDSSRFFLETTRSQVSGQVGGFAAEVFGNSDLLPHGTAAAGRAHHYSADQRRLQRNGTGRTSKKRLLGTNWASHI